MNKLLFVVLYLQSRLYLQIDKYFQEEYSKLPGFCRALDISRNCSKELSWIPLGNHNVKGLNIVCTKYLELEDCQAQCLVNKKCFSIDYISDECCLNQFIDKFNVSPDVTEVLYGLSCCGGNFFILLYSQFNFSIIQCAIF